MNTENIRQQLLNYIDVADDKKLKAIYALIENEITESSVEYTDGLKAELDKRVNYYLNGGKMVAPSEMHQRFQIVQKTRK